MLPPWRASGGPVSQCHVRVRDGQAMAKRDETHRMADANKAFAHFAW